MTNERSVNIHEAWLEGFAYSQWMASADSSEWIDWIAVKKEADLVVQEGLTTEKTVTQL